jgi:hypothetical protein
MKAITTLIVLIFFSLPGFSQESQKLSFNQIGLTVELPADFQIISKHETDKKLQRGINAVAEETNITIDLSNLIMLFSASKNQFSYVSATIEKFDEKTDGPYSEANNMVKEIMYTTLKGKIQDKPIDTISSVIEIDGVSFDKFEVSIILEPNFVLRSILISKLYKGYDLGISYVYVDEKTKEQMDKMLAGMKLK